MIREISDNCRRSRSSRRMRESYNQDGGYITVFDVNVNKIASEVNDAIYEAVQYIDSGDAYPTWHWEIGHDDEKMWCLVLGFADGFEPNDDEFTDSDGMHLALKFGAISNRNVMYEYDMDFEMPYDAETGEVWDSEVTIDSFNATSDVKYVLDSFEEFAREYNANLPNDDFDESIKRSFRSRRRTMESKNRRFRRR